MIALVSKQNILKDCFIWQIIPLEAHTKARGFIASQPMLDQRRQPKPKTPIGNDIGTARGLNPMMPSRLADHLEATVSVGFTMSTAQNQTSQDKESAYVDKEMRKVMESVPSIPYLYYQRDPDEEDLERRVTQVARQLAETSIRKEYEQSKFGPLPALFTGKPEYRQPPKPHNTPTVKPPPDDNLTEIEQPLPAPKLQENKPRKSGKSYDLSNSLPLVSHLPADAAQLQLIAEVQQIPHFMVSEGFPPRTPAPELTGPLLGGPLRTEEVYHEERAGRSMEKPTRLSSFLRRISPKLGTVSNDVVVSLPMETNYYPPLVAQTKDWWGRPSSQFTHS